MVKLLDKSGKIIEVEEKDDEIYIKGNKIKVKDTAIHPGIELSAKFRGEIYIFERIVGSLSAEKRPNEEKELKEAGFLLYHKDKKIVPNRLNIICISYNYVNGAYGTAGFSEYSNKKIIQHEIGPLSIKMEKTADKAIKSVALSKGLDNILQGEKELREHESQIKH